jgi:hypothetical protein
MGLAPSANGENPGKTSLAKVPVPISLQPRRAQTGESKLDRRVTSEEQAPFRQRTGRSGVELSETKLTVRGMKRRQRRNSSADMFIPDYPIVHDDSRIAGGVITREFGNCPAKNRKNSVLGGVP